MQPAQAGVPRDILKTKALRPKEGGVIAELEAALVTKKRSKKQPKIDADYDKKRRSTLQRLNQFLVGTFDLPVEDLSLPEAGLAARDVEYDHCFFLAEQMEVQGPSYPGKPAVACAFEVFHFSLDMIGCFCMQVERIGEKGRIGEKSRDFVYYLHDY